MNKEKSESDFADAHGDVQSTAAAMAPAAKADVSDVQSHSNSLADEATIYAVAAGDNLSKIAEKFYGDAEAWKQIFDANRDQLIEPDGIKIGQMLKIPAKS
jgi:nucleoid-associated protein YgaU